MAKRRDDFDYEKWLEDRALKDCRPATRGIWMDAICNMNILNSAGKLTGSVENLSKLCRCNESDFLSAIGDLREKKAADVLGEVQCVKGSNGRVTVVCNSDVTLINRRLARLAEARKSNRDRQQEFRDRKTGKKSRKRNRKVTEPSNGAHNENVTTDPPMVFPPTTPLSLTPQNLLSAREAENPELPPFQAPEPVPDEIVQPALRAFELWSRKSRGYPLIDVQNEVRAVRELLGTLRQNPPVFLANGAPASQESAVPLAVDVLIKNSKDFKSIKYACGCVKNALEDWQRSGMPGAKIEGKNGACRPSAPPTTKTILRDYGPELARKESQ